jgi:nicotinate phosphoribosyltransferase
MTVDGVAAVKLSDNAKKATGPEDLMARYRRVFGSAAMDGAAVVV